MEAERTTATATEMLDSIGVKTFPSNCKQLLIYYLDVMYNVSDLFRKQYNRYYFPTEADAERVRNTVRFFLDVWDMGYDGGSISSRIKPIVCVFDPHTESLYSNDIKINVTSFIRQTAFLRSVPYPEPFAVPKYQYNEYLLHILNYVGFEPRIKKSNCMFTKFEKVDEEVIRRSNLVYDFSNYKGAKPVIKHTL
jgi:hypothetical protein